MLGNKQRPKYKHEDYCFGTEQGTEEFFATTGVRRVLSGDGGSRFPNKVPFRLTLVNSESIVGAVAPPKSSSYTGDDCAHPLGLSIRLF
jgi:hypothetical protein